jgi:uncharacterized damage-inducible protein DinB
MITRDWCRLMAAYNSAMNQRLYRAAAQLTEAQRQQDRGAFFGSLHATLCHLVWADSMWMSRFAGWPAPPGGIPGSTKLHASFEPMAAERMRIDAGLEAWAATVSEDWLRGSVTWLSGATGRHHTKPTWAMVTHMFNHQTHHRGQAHALLTQAGVTPEDTDIQLVVDLAALGLG